MLEPGTTSRSGVTKEPGLVVLMSVLLSLNTLTLQLKSEGFAEAIGEGIAEAIKLACGVGLG